MKFLVFINLVLLVVILTTLERVQEYEDFYKLAMELDK